MKNQYVKPMATVEEFVANGFVTTCTDWQIACDKMGTNSSAYDDFGNHDNFHLHRKNQCGSASKQTIHLRPDGGFVIYESAGFGMGTLACTLTDSKWNPVYGSKDYYEIKPGERLYWTTTYDWSEQGYRNIGVVTYHHSGVVGRQIGSHDTNRS